jgi:hypothetical protein
MIVALLTLAVWSRPTWPIPSRGILRALLVGLYISAPIFISATLIGVSGLLFLICVVALAVFIENIKKAVSREADIRLRLA